MNEYRKVMEQKLGRKLSPKELVHHKDGDSHNDDPENLALTDNETHPTLPHPSPEEWERAILDILEKEDDFRGVSLSKSLDAFFTARQKEIIFSRLHGFPQSKTEQEYYSRTIKKKLRAITNPMLQKLINYLL